jgi:phospho-N-acetylmuramoyl-pentapeptide-transferase
VVFALGMGLYLTLYPIDNVQINSTHVPFVKDIIINWGWLFIPLVIGVITATTNGVNLTDGLDGLATGTMIFAISTFGIIAYIAGHIEFSKYLRMEYMAGAGELTVFIGAVVGACMGFLWYNCHPAQVFLGDTGSLALGGALGTISILLKEELLLIVVGGLFVIETLSVMMQVFWYKRTKKRIFKMAPIHHHFELCGWHESKIVTRFVLVSAFLMVLALSTLKIR